MTKFEYPVLTEQDQKTFTSFLIKMGYSKQYASAVPTYHYEGRGKFSCQKRARTLFRAWLEKDGTACSPNGPRETKEHFEQEPVKEEVPEETIVSPVAPLSKKWSLIMHICISEAPDELKESLIRKILE